MRRSKRDIVSVSREHDTLTIKYQSLLSRNHLLSRELARIRQQNIELRAELSDYRFKELKRNSHSLDLSPVRLTTTKKKKSQGAISWNQTATNKIQQQEQSEIIVGSDENIRNINITNVTANATTKGSISVSKNEHMALLNENRW